MARVRITAEDRYLGEITLENGSEADLSRTLFDDPRKIMQKEIDTTVAKVKQALGIEPNDVNPTALGAAAAYVTALPNALAMTEKELGQAIIDRLAEKPDPQDHYTGSMVMGSSIQTIVSAGGILKGDHP